MKYSKSYAVLYLNTQEAMQLLTTHMTEFAQMIIREHIAQQTHPLIAVDGTVGNGHDTLFLAQLVGEKGKVYGFDIQEQALQQTKQLLEKHQCHEQVQLFHQGHETLSQSLPTSEKGHIHIFMFNLGYLPGSDKTIITRPETTLAALKQALDWLAPSGIITVVSYIGHPEGLEETYAIQQWASTLPPYRYVAFWHQLLNRPLAPSLTVIKAQ